MKVYKEQLVRKVGKDINVGWLKEQWQGNRYSGEREGKREYSGGE